MPCRSASSSTGPRSARLNAREWGCACSSWPASTPAPPPPGSAHAAVHDALWSLCDIAPAVVLNRPAAMAGNGSKPYQATQARAAGFATPDTLITTSPDAARRAPRR